MRPDLQKRISLLSINPDTTLMAALQQMHSLEAKLLLVMIGPRFLSLLSVGDIQRAIIRQAPLDSPVSGALRTQIRVAQSDEAPENVRQRMLELRTELMPVLDQQGNLTDLLFWDDAVPREAASGARPLAGVPVVVMAGGLGTRLRPLTNVIPKALVPLGDQPIIEEIIDRFCGCGADEFYVSLNYKAEMVERYLCERGKSCRLYFFREDQPLGTGGSLQLVSDRLLGTFFVSNCDTLVDCDYADILRVHREDKNEITAVAAVNVQSLPYGIFECDATGRLVRLREKPDLSHLINVGLYVFEPHVLSQLVEQQSIGVTELIERVRQGGGRVGLFPISESAWVDIGEWPSYYRALSQRLRPRNRKEGE
jgi:dTDP-glucose pyrophosphorylase